MSEESSKLHPVVERYARYVNPAFVKMLGVFGYGRVFTRALDVHMWDDEGKRYLDFFSGYGAANVGHNHPRLTRRLRDLLEDQLPNILQVGPSTWEAELAERLAGLLPDPLEVCMFASSGAEAVEAAMKLARVVTGRRNFVYCRGGFHGTNLGTLSVMGEARMRTPFEPLLEGCNPVDYGDMEQLEGELSNRQVAGFVVEPIQCEGGVTLPPEGYLRAALDLCRGCGTLMILDEVQTGLGRTGHLFALEAEVEEGEPLIPDVVVLGNSLAGGLAPLSAAVTTREHHEKAYGTIERFDLHSSTFKGNTLACVAALETLAILEEEELVARGARTGALLHTDLRARLDGHPLVRDVRGRGALVGIEFGPTDEGWMNRMAPFLVNAVARQVFGQWAAYRLLEEGVICQPTSHQWNVLRLEPPLTAGAEHVEEVVGAVRRVLEDYQGIGRVLRDASRKVGGQFLKGWKF